MVAAADAKETTASAAGSPPVSLDTPFLYQNRQNGQPSSAPLTARQLCRILCPAAGSSSTSIITPQTLLLGFDQATNTYDPIGWRGASSIPVLREACASWYYESKGGGGVKGSVSTRVLADLLNGTNDAGDEDKIDVKTRIFPADSSNDSSGGNGKWTSIQDLSNLQLAMEALTETKSMPTNWPANDDDDKNMEQVAKMTYDVGENEGSQEEDREITQQKVQDDLEVFLSSTDHLAPHAGAAVDDGESDIEEYSYESDGGTRYVRDSHTGNWVHEALAPKKEKMNEKKDAVSSSTSKAGATPATKKRKRNKPKFSAKNARNWIYVTGLPKDTNEEEVATYFLKAGIIDLDPETQKPKVKLYRHKKGKNGDQSGALKGDASICYARPESVELALQILDENLFRDGATLSVQRAKFEQSGTFDDDNKNGGRRMISESKRKVARLAALQAVGWDEGENGRIAGGLKGLRIVVLMNMFDPRELEHDKNDEKLQKLEKEVHAECEEIGVVEKITVFSKHPAGVMIVKFTQPTAASDAVNTFNGKVRENGRKVEASYWDGVTDYTCRDMEKEEKETEKRLDEFGDWLENQALPDEFKLKVEE
jgi:RNA recognition motif-containing protein